MCFVLPLMTPATSKGTLDALARPVPPETRHGNPGRRGGPCVSAGTLRQRCASFLSHQQLPFSLRVSLQKRAIFLRYKPYKHSMALPMEQYVTEWTPQILQTYKVELV